jgi:hypothetical protein
MATVVTGVQPPLIPCWGVQGRSEVLADAVMTDSTFWDISCVVC